MFRFNQAWLLDSLNGSVYYGFAVLTGKQERLKTSVKYFEKSWQLDSTESKILPDWALSLVELYERVNDTLSLKKSEVLLDKFLSKDTSYANAFELRASCYYYKKEYEKAWQNLHKCRKINEKEVPVGLINALLKVSSDPTGFYKK